MRSLLLAVLAALCAWAAFPPVGIEFLVLLVVPLLTVGVLQARSSKTAIAVGLLFGVTFMGLLMSWLLALGVEAMMALILSQALWFPLWSRLVWRFRDAPSSTLATVAIGGWAASEFARARLPAGGLNWGALSYPLGEWAEFRSVAHFVGASGLEVIVVAMGVLIGLAVLRFRSKYGVVAAAILVAGIGVGSLADSGPVGEVVRVTIVQGNSPCPQTHCQNERQLIFENHLRLTRQIEAGSTDLVLWAESSSSFPATASDPRAQEVSAEAQRIGAVLVSGGDRGGTTTTFVNSNIFFSSEGQIVGEYLKNHPVPFGEYIPLRSIFGDLSVTSQVPRDMERGEGPVVVTTPFGDIGSVISFEGAFARYGRSSVAEGAQLLIVASNESSYGESSAADQFIGMTRMRAAENGVDVIHGAVTGASVVITNGGELGEQSDLFEDAVIEGVVRMRTQGPTLYTRWGDWLAVAAMVAAAYAAMVQIMQDIPPVSRDRDKPLETS